jgi:hypothetical protein
MESNISTHVSDSDISRRSAEAAEEATATMERYYDYRNGEQMLFDLDLDTHVAKLAADPDNVWATDDLLLTIQQQLDALAWNKAVPGVKTLIGRVSVDLRGRFDRTWGLPPYTDETGDLIIPRQLVFVSFTKRQRLYEAGVRQAAALHYLPPARAIDKTDRMTGRPITVSIDGEWAGYLGVARWFGSRQEATDALGAVKRAIKVLSTDVSDTAYEDDPIRSLDVEEKRRAQPLI